MPDPFTVNMTFVRVTKNTYRYEEQAPSGEAASHETEKIGVLYIKKHALGDLPSPEITVTVTDRGPIGSLSRERSKQ